MYCICMHSYRYSNRYTEHHDHLICHQLLLVLNCHVITHSTHAHIQGIDSLVTFSTLCERVSYASPPISLDYQVMIKY